MLVFIMELNSVLNHKCFLLRFLLSGRSGMDLIFSVETTVSQFVIVVRCSFIKALFIAWNTRFSFTDHGRNLLGDRWWMLCLWIYYNSLLTFLFYNHFIGDAFLFVNQRWYLRSLLPISYILQWYLTNVIWRSCKVFFYLSRPLGPENNLVHHLWRNQIYYHQIFFLEYLRHIVPLPHITP